MSHPRDTAAAALVALCLWHGALAQPVCQSLAPERYDKHLLVILLDDIPPPQSFAEMAGFVQDASEGVGPRSALYAETPVLDSLAMGGLRFYSFRTMPVCSPSRASLLTGLYPFHHGVGTVITHERDGAVGAGGLAEFNDPGFEVTTIFPLLSAQGVRTAFIGKLHLSAWIHQTFLRNPGRQGSGWQILDQVVDPMTFVRTQLRNLNQRPVPGSDDTTEGGYYNYFSNATAFNGDAQPESLYTTSWQFEQARQFLSSLRARDRGFCYLALNACHAPFGDQGNPPDPGRDFPPPTLYTTQEYRDKVDQATSEGIDTIWPQYMASFEAVDVELGLLLAALPTRVRDRLSVLILGDNGVEPALADGRVTWGKDFGENWNRLIDETLDARLKASPYLWGSTTYAIWNGPGRDTPDLPTAGLVSRAFVDIVDVAPTIAAFFDVPFPACDGVSFLPIVYDGVSAEEHARQFSLAEEFWPNGDWHKITQGDGPDERLARSFHCQFSAAEFANGVGGRFSLVRQMRSGIYHDELYHLSAEDGTPVDPFEFDDLLLQGGYEEQYYELLARLYALLEGPF